MALTAEREILNARVQVHDALGNSLLSIRRFLVNGGTEAEKKELTDRLALGVLFLKNDRPAAERDEYELMLETAAQLGVRVSVTGALPQSAPSKHILATAIHECFTNTLRHAHGDELRVEITQDGDFIEAVFTNNGEQPQGEITEKGGLVSLRALTEQAGGTMTIRFAPAYAVVIRLPKEGDYAI